MNSFDQFKGLIFLKCGSLSEAINMHDVLDVFERREGVLVGSTRSDISSA